MAPCCRQSCEISIASRWPRHRSTDALHGLASRYLHDGAAGGEHVVRRLHQMIARRAMANQMPESIRMGRRKVGFNSPMPEWLNGPLSGWTAALPSRKFRICRTGRRGWSAQTVNRLTASKTWDWESVGRIWPYLNMKWTMAGSSAQNMKFLAPGG